MVAFNVEKYETAYSKNNVMMIEDLSLRLIFMGYTGRELYHIGRHILTDLSIMFRSEKCGFFLDILESAFALLLLVPMIEEHQ